MKRGKKNGGSEVMNRFKEHKMARLGLTILLLELLIVILVPIFTDLDPYTIDPLAFGAGPSAAHPLGTDTVGRDILARVIYGGRVSLQVGILSTLIGLVIGVPLGLIAGYFRGWCEIIIMRLADIFMSIPSFVLVLVLVAVVGPSVWSVTVVIGVLGWTQFARLIYGNVLSVREKEYVESAKAIGTKSFKVICQYVLPNSVAPILIAITFRTASAIIMEASLSFLGMGVQAPQASWGNLMYDAQSIVVLSTKPWVWLPPGIALIITTLSINFFGDGVRDALDPKMKI